MKALKILSMLFFTLALGITAVSCGGKDDDENVVQEPDPVLGLYGTWIERGTGYSVSFTFNEDGTGILRQTETTSEGHSQTTSLNFSFTYSEAAGLLKLYLSGDNVVYNCSVQLTGNTLMLTIDDEVFVLKRS